MNGNILEVGEELAPRDVIKRYDAAMVISRGASASNDEIRGEPAIGKLVFDALRAKSAMTRQAHLRYRQHAEAWAAHDGLRRLDDRALHVLGFDRREFGSVAADATEVARTQACVLHRHRTA